MTADVNEHTSTGQNRSTDAQTVVNRPPERQPEDGVLTITLESPSSWDQFHREIQAYQRGYVWRGQRVDWRLKSSFDRHFGITDQPCRLRLLLVQLNAFANEMEESHPSVLPPRENEIKIWALGQHYGLRTPLLDWTKCPYIAAYFALEKKPGNDGDHHRYVYALSRKLERLKWKLKLGDKVLSRTSFVSFVDLEADEFPRLDKQQGVFTKALNGADIERNVRRWELKRRGDVLLVKFRIPTQDRDSWLHNLHEKGIDGVRLLLDLRDVVERCNK